MRQALPFLNGTPRSLRSDAFQPPFDGNQIVEKQLGFQGRNVCGRIDAILGVGDIGVVKGACDEQQSIVGGDGVEKRAAKWTLLVYIAGQASNVVVGNLCMDGLARGKHPGERIKARIRHVHHGCVDFELSAGVGSCCGGAAGQRVKDRRLAAI